MEIYNESDMKKGWFIGDFSPTALKTKDCEVAVKRYKAGDKENLHVHKIATEITFVITGKIRMNSLELEKGSIVVLNPGESSDFFAIEDSITLAFKTPCIIGDKYDLHST